MNNYIEFNTNLEFIKEFLYFFFKKYNFIQIQDINIYIVEIFMFLKNINKLKPQKII